MTDILIKKEKIIRWNVPGGAVNRIPDQWTVRAEVPDDAIILGQYTKED